MKFFKFLLYKDIECNIKINLNSFIIINKMGNICGAPR